MASICRSPPRAHTLRNLKPQFPKLYNFFEGAWSPARSPRDPATPNGLIGLTVTLFRSAARGVVGESAERPARSPYADPAVLERAVITRQDTTGHRLERAPVFTRQDTTGTAIQRTSSLTPANALTRSSALTRSPHACTRGASWRVCDHYEGDQLLQSVFDSLRTKLVDLTFPKRGFTFTGSNPSDGYSRPCASACNVEVSSTTR